MYICHLPAELFFAIVFCFRKLTHLRHRPSIRYVYVFSDHEMCKVNHFNMFCSTLIVDALLMHFVSLYFQSQHMVLQRFFSGGFLKHNTIIWNGYISKCFVSIRGKSNANSQFDKTKTKRKLWRWSLICINLLITTIISLFILKLL